MVLHMPRKKHNAKNVELANRVTLPLAKDTMDAIKWMAYNGGYGGQGRTVDALVEAVADSEDYIGGFVRANATAQLLQSGAAPVDQAQLQQLIAIQLLNAGIIIDRLRKFVGVDTRAIMSEVRRHVQARAKAAAEGPAKTPGGGSETTRKTQ